MRPFRDSVVVVCGCSTVRGTSAIEAVKRMMSCKISSGGTFAAITLAALQGPGTLFGSAIDLETS